MACNLSVNSLEKAKERKGQTTGKGRGLRRDSWERKEEPKTVLSQSLLSLVVGLPGLGVVCDQNETLFFVFILLPTMHAIFVGEDATKVNEISL